MADTSLNIGLTSTLALFAAVELRAEDEGWACNGSSLDISDLSIECSNVGRVDLNRLCGIALRYLALDMAGEDGQYEHIGVGTYGGNLVVQVRLHSGWDKD